MRVKNVYIWFVMRIIYFSCEFVLIFFHFVGDLNCFFCLLDLRQSDSHLRSINITAARNEQTNRDWMTFMSIHFNFHQMKIALNVKRKSLREWNVNKIKRKDRITCTTGKSWWIHQSLVSHQFQLAQIKSTRHFHDI